ncbi:MAG: hypothetical protein LBK13_06185, partial [Spirochaetales bacterium]|nr:hypothetical protein [Spirochaetales bacterium]
SRKRNCELKTWWRAAAGGDSYVHSALRAVLGTTQFCPAKLPPPGYTRIITEQQLCAPEIAKGNFRAFF